ncbi:MAG: LCP family protein [Chthonomonas sp.]|nr:LCP family protein [Chthonomonas sp.]
MAAKKKKPIWLRILAGLTYGALCLAMVSCGTIWYAFNQSETLTQFMRQKVFNTPPQVAFNNENTVNMLILGCDEDRYYGGKQVLKTAARSDMILLARLDFVNRKITGVSIPRDVVVEMPGFRRSRINAFHAMGSTPEEGRQLAKRAVEYVLGVDVDRVMEVNYEKFQEMIDLVGGVEVFVDKPLKYTDKRGGLFIDIDAGRQHLAGYDAMCFVRYRKGDSDFKRQDRQKQLLFAFKEQLFHQPGKLPTVVEKVREVLGNELSAEEVAALGLFAQAIGNDNIKLGQVPVIELQHYDLAIDRDKLDETLRTYNFREGRETAYRVAQ